MPNISMGYTKTTTMIIEISLLPKRIITIEAISVTKGQWPMPVILATRGRDQ
jgi:hypothetical protein